MRIKDHINKEWFIVLDIQNNVVGGARNCNLYNEQGPDLVFCLSPPAVSVSVSDFCFGKVVHHVFWTNFQNFSVLFMLCFSK